MYLQSNSKRKTILTCDTLVKFLAGMVVSMWLYTTIHWNVGPRRVTFVRLLANVEFQNSMMWILCIKSVTFDRLLHTLITCMHRHRVTVCELCSTSVTFVRFISNTDTYMHLRSINVCKLCSTSITFVKFLLWADTHMCLQSTTMRKPCSTSITVETFLSSVDTHLHL